MLTYIKIFRLFLAVSLVYAAASSLAPADGSKAYGATKGPSDGRDAAGADPLPVFDIPFIDGIKIDGLGDDWKGGGFFAGYIPTADGKTRPVEDFDPGFRLAWNEKGLYVLADVIDDVAVEHPEERGLWRLDCVEFFVADSVGSPKMWQLVVTSGADQTYGMMRKAIYDHRPEGSDPAELMAETAAEAGVDGYTVEAMLPWNGIGVTPETGLEVAFQFVANDDDGEEDGNRRSMRVGWYPSSDTHEDTSKMHRVRLSEASSPPDLCRVSRYLFDNSGEVVVKGASELAGEEVVVFEDRRVFARGRMEKEGSRAGISLRVDAEKGSGMVHAMKVSVGGRICAEFERAPTLGSLLGRCVKAMGGKERITKIDTRICRGKIIHEYSNSSDPKREIEMELIGKIGGRWWMSGRWPDGAEYNGFDGKIGWKRTMEGIQRDDRLAVSPVGWVATPRNILRVKGMFPNIAVIESRRIKGEKCWLARPPGRNRDKWSVFFSDSTGLVTCVGSKWFFNEYGEVDGVLFPGKVTLERGSLKTTFIFEEVEHNRQVDDNVFMMPDPAEEMPEIFGDIDDKRVLEMLEHLPYRYGGMNVPPTDGRLLYDLIIERGYTRGLEIGTSNGYSALWLGLAFRKTGGKLITMEYEPLRAKEAQYNFSKAGLDDVIDLRAADAFKEIPLIEGKFDFIFLDAWKTDYPAFLELIRDRVKPGGVIAAHNVVSHERGIREFLRALEDDKSLETVINRDSPAGVSISVVKR